MGTGSIPPIMNIKEDEPWWETALEGLLEGTLMVGGGILGMSVGGPGGAMVGANLGQQIGVAIHGDDQEIPAGVASAVGYLGAQDVSSWTNPFTDPDKSTAFGKMMPGGEQPIPTLEAGALDIAGQESSPVGAFSSLPTITTLPASGIPGPRTLDEAGGLPPSPSPLQVALGYQFSPLALQPGTEWLGGTDKDLTGFYDSGEFGEVFGSVPYQAIPEPPTYPGTEWDALRNMMATQGSVPYPAIPFPGLSETDF